MKDVLRATGRVFSLQQWVAPGLALTGTRRSNRYRFVWSSSDGIEPKPRQNWRTGCAIIARSTAPTMVSCERPSPNPVTMPAKRRGRSRSLPDGGLHERG